VGNNNDVYPKEEVNVGARIRGTKSAPDISTIEGVMTVAQGVAQAEIVSMSEALAAQVQAAIAAGLNLEPIQKRLEALYGGQNQTTLLLNALIDLLVEKGIFTKDALGERVNSLAERHLAKMKAEESTDESVSEE
jgi:DNA uptake protein ComE-like DNA-binding protein